MNNLRVLCRRYKPGFPRSFLPRAEDGSAPRILLDSVILQPGSGSWDRAFGASETWALVIATPKGGVRAVIAGAAWGGPDTAAPGPGGVSDPVSRRGIRAEREGSEGTAPEPGRIQPGQFLVFTL